MAVDTRLQLERIREQLDPPLARSEERTLETGGVTIFVRRRADRYYLDDRGVAAVRSTRRATGCESLRRSSRRTGST
jgi:hypothetical protein